MQKEFWYITDKQIKLAKEENACSSALEWAEKERDWRKISADWLAWDVENTKMCPVEALIDLSKNSYWGIRESVARHSNTPIGTLIELSKDLDPGVRYSVAQNRNTPTEILIELSKDPYSDVRESVARHSNTPIGTLIELSKDSQWDVRESVARHSNVSVEILINLSKDSHWDVRYSVAQNPNTPVETLIELSKDSHWTVRYWVAQHPDTPVETLIELSKDSDAYVRYSVAQNRNTSLDVLKILSQDKNEKVQQTAKTNLKTKDKTMLLSGRLPTKITLVYSTKEVTLESGIKVLPTFPVDAYDAKALKKATSWALTKGGGVEYRTVDNLFNDIRLVDVVGRQYGNIVFKVLINGLYLIDLRKDVFFDTCYNLGISIFSRLKGKYRWSIINGHGKMIEDSSELMTKLKEKITTQDNSQKIKISANTEKQKDKIKKLIEEFKTTGIFIKIKKINLKDFLIFTKKIPSSKKDEKEIRKIIKNENHLLGTNS